jgi:hypothetical protein
MQPVHLYHRLAKQSAELADEMVMLEHRKALLDIAEAWERAAEEREQMLRRLSKSETGTVVPYQRR